MRHSCCVALLLAYGMPCVTELLGAHGLTSAKRVAGTISKVTRPASAPSPVLRQPAQHAPETLPPDNYLGPAAGKMTVYENLKKLQYDLFRAEERSKHAEAVQKDMERKHRIYADNVRRVKGAHATCCLRNTRMHVWPVGAGQAHN